MTKISSRYFKTFQQYTICITICLNNVNKHLISETIALMTLYVPEEAGITPHPHRGVMASPFALWFPWQQHVHTCVLGSISFTILLCAHFLRSLTG